MESLLAVYSRQERHIQPIPDQANVGVVATDRQETEAELKHLRSSGAVDNRVKVGLPGSLFEFLRDIRRRLALDGDDMIGAVLLCNCELVRIAGECDNFGSAAEQLCILNAIRA